MRLAERGRALGRRIAVGVTLIALVLGAGFTATTPTATAATASTAATAASARAGEQHALADPQSTSSHWIGLAPRARLAHAIDPADSVAHPAPSNAPVAAQLPAQPQSSSERDDAAAHARAPPAEGTA
jgi:hypothetical protein